MSLFYLLISITGSRYTIALKFAAIYIHYSEEKIKLEGGILLQPTLPLRCAHVVIVISVDDDVR